MAIRSGFFDSDIIGYDTEGLPIFDRAEDSEFFAKFFGLLVKNGVFANPADNFKVLAKSGMKLTVKRGACWIEGRFAFDIEDSEITLEAADPVMDRIDRVVLKMDLQSRDIKLAVKTGEPSANPVPPVLERPESGSADVYELCIAEIRVVRNSSGITQDKILDTRLSDDLCGIVTAAVESVDVTELFNQYKVYVEKNFKEWDAEKKRHETEWLEHMAKNRLLADEVRSWYESVKVDISKLQTFYFDNLSEMGGCTRETTANSSKTIYTETIFKTVSREKVAERITTKVNSNKYIINVKVFADGGDYVMREATIEVVKLSNGGYRETVTSDTFNGLPSRFRVSPNMGLYIVNEKSKSGINFK